MIAPVSSRRAAFGFTLIEVLIAILIFSVGILGAIGMQAKLQQTTSQNGDRARASMQANEMASQMWAQQTADPSSNTLLASYYANWQTRISTGLVGLPNGSAGTVAYSSSTKTSTITVTWREPSATTNSSFTTSVVIP